MSDFETERGGGFGKGGDGMRRRVLLGNQRGVKRYAVKLTEAAEQPYDILRVPWVIHACSLF